MKNWLLAIGAFLAALGFAILQRPERQLKKVEGQLEGVILDGSKRAERRAVAAVRKADKLQAEAVEAEKLGREVVNDVGKNGESMGDMLDSWRKSGGL